MTPFGKKWKWGRTEVGIVSPDMILTKVADLIPQGKYFALHEVDQKKIEILVKDSKH